MFCDGVRFEASKQIISKVMLMQCWDSVAQNSLCFIADNLNTSSESVSEVASNILLRGGGGPPVYTRWGQIVITRRDHSSLLPQIHLRQRGGGHPAEGEHDVRAEEEIFSQEKIQRISEEAGHAGDSLQCGGSRGGCRSSSPTLKHPANEAETYYCMVMSLCQFNTNLLCLPSVLRNEFLNIFWCFWLARHS